MSTEELQGLRRLILALHAGSRSVDSQVDSALKIIEREVGPYQFTAIPKDQWFAQ